MRNSLLVFGGFAHDPQRVLTAINQFAFVSIKREIDALFGVTSKLKVAAFAHADHGRLLFNDPQATFWHNLSLAQSAGLAEIPVKVKRHHYRLRDFEGERFGTAFFYAEPLLCAPVGSLTRRASVTEGTARTLFTTD